MRCQHLPAVGRSRGEKTIPRKRMEQVPFPALIRFDVSYSPSPVWAGGASQVRGW